MKEKLEIAPHIIIDCSFEEHHIEKDNISLINQLSQMLGSNRRADSPARIVVTGIGSKTMEQLNARNAQNWLMDLNIKDYKELYEVKDLVYLTGDAEDELTSLEPE